MTVQKEEEIGNKLYYNIMLGFNKCDIKMQNTVFVSLIIPETKQKRMDKWQVQDVKIRLNSSDEYIKNRLFHVLNQKIITLDTSHEDIIERVIKDLTEHDEKFEIVCECGKYQSAEKGYFSEEYWQAYIMMIPQEHSCYSELVQFVLQSIMSKMKYVNEADCEDDNIAAMRNFYSMLDKKWILMQSYAEYMLDFKQWPQTELLTKLSAQKYEGSECEARIYFEDGGVQIEEEFDDMGKETRKIEEKNIRVIRKLMEISKRNKLYLFAEKEQKGEEAKSEWTITKLVSEKKENPICNNGNYIKFSGFMNWSVFYQGKEKLVYRNGIYIVNYSHENRIYEQKIKKIQGITETERKMLLELVRALAKQKHGTAVILADFDQNEQIEKEVNRLCEWQYGMKIKSKIHYDIFEETWDEDLLLSITEIDGALFVDWTGKCLAIGVIVDGTVNQKGNTGRGSRYNSISNYIRAKTSGRYLGVIISEDENVDFVGLEGKRQCPLA